MFDFLLAENQRVREMFQEYGVGEEEQKFVKYLISGDERFIGTEPANDQVRVIAMHFILVMKSKSFSVLVPSVRRCSLARYVRSSIIPHMYIATTCKSQDNLALLIDCCKQEDSY